MQLARWKLWTVAGVAFAVVCLLVAFKWHERSSLANANDDKKPADREPVVRVNVVRPQQGGLQRISDQPGTVRSFDYAQLYGKVSGYLKNQIVDIGDTVNVGEQLATIDAPEYQQELNRAKAALTEARSQVTLKQALVKTARANLKVANAGIEQAKSELARANAEHKFREQQYQRISELFKLKSIEERLVDEKDEQRHAAEAAADAAQASIATSQANAESAAAKVEQALAEVQDAQAQVEVAQAAVGRAQVFVEYTKIISPYNGVVTRRDFHEGDFIRGAGEGGGTPILTVARVDLMRVVVQVPERDVPFLHPGDKAVVVLDALPDRQFHAKVSRLANSEDLTTRSMRTEIDLPNPDGELRDGMYLRVTIFLDAQNKGVTIPSSCLVEDEQGSKTSVYLVREGKALKKHVDVGRDDGIRVEILDRLSTHDQVVVHPGGDLTDGDPVKATEPGQEGDHDRESQRRENGPDEHPGKTGDN